MRRPSRRRMPEQSREAVIAILLSSLSVPLWPSSSRHAFHGRNLSDKRPSVPRIAEYQRRLSPARIPRQGEHRGNLLLSDTALRVVPHVRGRASAASLALPLTLFLSLSLSPFLPLSALLVPSLPLCFALPDATVSFRRFRSFLVVFSRLFPTCQERRNALRLRRVYAACSPGGTKA